MHVCSSYMHLHGPLVVPCDVCGGRGDGQGTAPSILVQHLECNQTSADQHFETKHTFDQVQHSTSSKCSMVNPKKLLAEPEEKQTNSGLSQCPQTPFVPRTVWPMWSLISGVDNCILVTIRWSHVYKYVSPLGSAWLGEGARGFQPHPSPSSTSVGRSRSGSSTTFYLHYCYYSRPPVSRGRSGIFLLRPTTSTPTITTADHSSLPLSQLHQSTLPQSMLSPTIKTLRMRMRTMVMINNSWHTSSWSEVEMLIMIPILDKHL